MRFVYGFIALIFYCIFYAYLETRGVSIPENVSVICASMLIAGAFAGGD